MEQKKKTLTQLFVPICLETLLYMLSGMVDTLMLSSVNDQAVGAVGTANTYIGIFIIMFSVISSGMVAVMTLIDGVQVSSRAMVELLQLGIPVTWLSSRGAFFGRLESTRHVHVFRQAKQIELMDSPFYLEMGKRCIAAKTRCAKRSIWTVRISPA